MTEQLNDSETFEVPVLMYHRIADHGPEALQRYRVPASRLEEQVAFMKRHGYYSITSADFLSHQRERRPFRGRPVIMTFDDGYRDFAETAFPILRAAGMGAEVFIITEKVGTVADWDGGFGPPAPLMDWSDIRALATQGIRFGSHLATHRSMNDMSAAEVLDEGIKSKHALEAQLGYEVQSVSAPFGHINEQHRPLLAQAGYRCAFTVKHGRASLDDDPFELKRLEVFDKADIGYLRYALALPRPDVATSLADGT